MAPKKKTEVKENKESPPSLSGKPEKGHGRGRASAAKSRASPKSIAPLLDAENAAAAASSGRLSGFTRGLLE